MNDPITPLRVLYVEDSALDAEFTQRILARRAPHISLDVAPTLAAALARLAGGATTAYDLVLCDLNLPDGNGLAVLEHVRRQGLPLAVVILTASGDQAKAVAALQAGADDYLVKYGDYREHLPQTLQAALVRFRTAMTRRGRTLRVFYAENNPLDADLIRRHFQRHAPHIALETMTTGEELLARLPAGTAGAPPCDAVLLDFQLPGANAMTVAKVLRDERELDLPVILLAKEGSEESVAAAFRIGVSDYLIKRGGYLVELLITLERAVQQVELARKQAALQTASARLHRLLEASPTLLYALRLDEANPHRFTPTWISDNIARVLGYSTEECLTASWWMDRLHEDDREAVLAKASELLEQGSLLQEYRFYDAAGGIRWVRDQSRLLRDAQGRPAEVVGSWSDVTAERRAEERLRLDAAALAATRDGIMITDLQARILAVNPAFTDITGYTEAEVLERSPSLLASGRHDRAFFQAMWSSLLEAGHWQGEIWNRRKNGEIHPQLLSISTVPDAAGHPHHYVAVITDLTRIKKSEAQLDRLAHYDPLTGLPNRLLLHSNLEHALERAQRQEHAVGLLVINLDQFKTVNESLGHTLGDELLLAVAQRFRQRLRSEDTLARPGGDEFALALERLDDSAQAERVAADLLSALEVPFVLSDGHEAHVRASIGISLFPDNGATAHDLLRQADTAMHRAKDQGGHQLAFYTGELNARALSRLELDAALARALDRGEFTLHYQPKADLSNGRITGAEALLRWHHPTRGMIPPADFIPAAERSGLIVAIGAWVMDEACRQLRAWRDEGLDVPTVAVNVSARQFRSGNLESVIRAALERHGVEASRLELELTESMLMESPEAATERLGMLKGLGVRLSLDDFGTGYSSLAYLSRFPVDQLKIDRSFVDGIASDPDAASIATSVIALAHRMRLKVVAEGVETEAQLAYLARHGCDEMQGYYFSRPLPAAELAALVRGGRLLQQAARPSAERTLLVVDDEPNVVSAIRRTLRGEGFRVLTAESAREGLDLLACYDVQVILSDQRMPEMSGTEFLARVKSLHPDTVRIVLSGYTELDSIIKAINTGAIYKFLTKPWDDGQLREHLRDAFRYHEAIVQPRKAD